MKGSRVEQNDRQIMPESSITLSESTKKLAREKRERVHCRCTRVSESGRAAGGQGREPQGGGLTGRGDGGADRSLLKNRNF